LVRSLRITFQLAIVWVLSPFLGWMPSSVRNCHLRLRKGVRPNWIRHVVRSFLDEVQHKLPESVEIQKRHRTWTSNLHEIGSVNLYEQRLRLASRSVPPMVVGAVSALVPGCTIGVDHGAVDPGAKPATTTITKCAMRQIENDMLKLYKSLSELMTR